MKILHILYVGQSTAGGTSWMRMNALKELGHDVTAIDTRPIVRLRGIKQLAFRFLNRMGFPPDLAGANDNIVKQIRMKEFDIVWFDSLREISRGTLREIKRESPDTMLVSLIMDDPFSRQGHSWRRFLSAIPLYDIHFVIREQNIQELKEKGARRVERFHKGFHPDIHRQVCTDPGDPVYDVFFAGHCEPKREKDIVFLLQQGTPVTIAGHSGIDWKRRGRHWNTIRQSFIDGGFYGTEYSTALSSAKIALCFYSQWNRDTENSRMYEIPACGTFMLAERNRENVKMFEEGREAEYFSSQKELLEKVKYYLSHPDERRRIAEAGRERCMKSGYSYHERLKKMLRTAVEAVEK